MNYFTVRTQVGFNLPLILIALLNILCFFPEAELYPRGHKLFPLPRKLKVIPRRKRESELWDFYPKLAVQVQTKYPSTKKQKGCKGQTSITSRAAVIKKNIDMPKLRELAANEHTDLRRDWTLVLCSITNTTNLRDKLVSNKYHETDEEVREFFDKESKVWQHV